MILRVSLQLCDFNQAFSAFSSVKSLNLSDTEIGLYVAINLSGSDRHQNIEGSKTIEGIQERLSEALLLQLQRQVHLKHIFDQIGASYV